jgi:hypothetical protein
VMVIVEKPCVDIPLAQGSLNCRKVHGQTTILTMSAGLGESCLGPPGLMWGQPPRLSIRAKLGNCDQTGFARIFFRTLAGSVSHAVLSTSLGAGPRMLIK